jgi:hypothetical protein
MIRLRTKSGLLSTQNNLDENGYIKVQGKFS